MVQKMGICHKSSCELPACHNLEAAILGCNYLVASHYSLNTFLSDLYFLQERYWYYQDYIPARLNWKLEKNYKYVCSIDGTLSDGLGKYVNDAKLCNCKMKKVIVNGAAHLCVFAVSHISCNEQLLYDYGADSNTLYWRDKVRIN